MPGGAGSQGEQSAGNAGAGSTVRNLLISTAPPRVQAASQRLDAAELAMMDTKNESAAMAYASALTDWGDAEATGRRWAPLGRGARQAQGACCGDAVARGLRRAAQRDRPARCAGPCRPFRADTPGPILPTGAWWRSLPRSTPC